MRIARWKAAMGWRTIAIAGAIGVIAGSAAAAVLGAGRPADIADVLALLIHSDDVLGGRQLVLAYLQAHPTPDHWDMMVVNYLLVWRELHLHWLFCTNLPQACLAAFG